MELFLFMTLSASLLIVIALILRPLTGRFLPRTVQMLFWSLAALRLLLPVRIAAPISLFSLFGLNADVQPASAPASMPVLFFSADSAVSADMSNPTVSVPVTPLTQIQQTAPAVTFTELLPLIWVTGAVLLAGVLVILHARELYRCRFKLRDREAEQQVPGYIQVYRTGAISAPFVTGVLRPQIILPDDLPTEELCSVLAHEVSHIRGLDVLKKYIFAAALCVNWFNPLVWLMTYLAAQDIEILCDNRALRGPLAPSARTYARALLYAQERRSFFTPGFRSHTETRILNILKAEKTNRFTSVISFLLAFVLVAVCVTQPVAASMPETDEQITEETVAPDLRLDYFIQNNRFCLNAFHLGASWEHIRMYMIEMGISADPVLQPGVLSPNLSYTVIPLALFGYHGTATLYFARNALTMVVCDFIFNEESSAAAAYNDILAKASGLFGNPASKPNDDMQKTMYWKKNSTRFTLGITAAKPSVYITRLTLDNVFAFDTGSFSAYTAYSNGIGNAELEVLQDYLGSYKADPYAQQELYDMYRDIYDLQTTLYTTENKLSRLQREYAETVLSNAPDELRSSVIRLVNKGFSFEDALLTAGLEQGLQTIEVIREQLPDLSGTKHRHLTVCSTGGTVLAEIDLPNENYYELFMEIKSAFGYYEINCIFTYNTP